MARSESLTAEGDMDSVIEKKAVEIATRMSERPGLAATVGDHSFIHFITDLLTELLPMLINCFGGPANALKELKNPGPLVRMRVRMIVRREMGDSRAFRAMGEPLIDSIFAVARNTTVRELEAAIR